MLWNRIILMLMVHFTVSVDHKNTTTGISAYERTMTARALIDHHANAEDFNRPGHLFH